MDVYGCYDFYTMPEPVSHHASEEAEESDGDYMDLEPIPNSSLEEGDDIL